MLLMAMDTDTNLQIYQALIKGHIIPNTSLVKIIL